MLQISTGKFYESTVAEHLFETVHRGVVYTNYSFLSSSIETKVGNILPATRWGDLNCVICEITERLPKPQGIIRSGMIASVGPDTLIQDFAAVVSFSLNATFTADEHLATRLVNGRSPGLGIAAVPKAFVPRIERSLHPVERDRKYSTRLLPSEARRTTDRWYRNRC